MMQKVLSQVRDRTLQIRVEGRISWKTADAVERAVKAGVWRVPRAIAVTVNSAQGSLVQADIVATTLQAAANKYNVPLYTFAEDFATGPGFWVLAAGHKVFADNYSLIGGVSVAALSLGLTGFAKQWKIETTPITSGKNKIRLNPFEKLKPEDEEWVQGLLKDQQQLFQSYVLKRRPKVSPDVLTGDVFKGRTALEKGLVDELGDLYAVLHRDFPDIRHWDRSAHCCKYKKLSVQDLLLKAQTQGVEETEVLELLEEEWTSAVSQRMVAEV